MPGYTITLFALQTPINGKRPVLGRFHVAQATPQAAKERLRAANMLTAGVIAEVTGELTDEQLAGLGMTFDDVKSA